MAASMHVAAPVQISVARENPAEKEPSHGEDRFSNLLSQRQPHDDTTPAKRVSPPKSKPSEPAKQKETKPDDTLHLLQSSAAIQPSVTAPAQADQSTQTHSAVEVVDDVLSTSVSKPAATPVIVAAATPDSSGAPADPAAAAASPVSTDATSEMAQLLQTTTPSTAATGKSTSTATAVSASNDPKKASAQSNTPVPRVAPTATPAFETPISTDAAPAPKNVDPSHITPMPVNPASSADSPTTNVQAANGPTMPSVATPIAQLDFSNAAPAIIATTIAAASTHHVIVRDVSSDDSLDLIDTTSPTGATPNFALPEHRDIATVDGKVPVPAPSSPQFGDALGAKLSWMAERHIGHAEIRLSPDDLGTVDVRIRLNGEHVRAEFNSANPGVRQAINDHIPRLREMLSQHGFNLAESHVGNGSNQSTPNTPEATSTASAEDEIAIPAPHVSAYGHDGILDAFA